MSHISQLIIDVQLLYGSGIPNAAIAEHLKISEEMVENIIDAYCNEID